MSLIRNMDRRIEAEIYRPDALFSIKDLVQVFAPAKDGARVRRVFDLRDVVRWHWRPRELQTLTRVARENIHPTDRIGIVVRHLELLEGLEAVAANVNAVQATDCIRIDVRTQMICRWLGISPWDDYEQLAAGLTGGALRVRSSSILQSNRRQPLGATGIADTLAEWTAARG